MAKERTILIMAANPKDTLPLRLDREVQEIQAALNKGPRKISFSIQQALAARPRDVRSALLEHRPQIVHFCGHGGGDQGLILESDNGTACMVSGAALSGLFELFVPDVKCVVLNACFSMVQAEAISSHVDYVIGMSREIGDKAAIEFAAGFYEALSAREPIERSFQFGRNAISLSGLSGEYTPVILKKGFRPSQAGEIAQPEAFRGIRSAGNELFLASFQDLWNARISAEDALKKLVEIDYENIVGLDPVAEGTAGQWIEFAQNNPEGYAFVIDRAKNIIGYWHFEAVDDRVYSSIIDGTFEDSDLTIDKARLMCCPGEYNVYFLIFVVRKPFRGYRVNRLLYDAFLQRIRSFEREGIRIVKVCANAFTPQGVGLCRGFGMRQVATHKRMGIIFEKKLSEEALPTGRGWRQRRVS